MKKRHGDTTFPQTAAKPRQCPEKLAFSGGQQDRQTKPAHWEFCLSALRNAMAWPYQNWSTEKGTPVLRSRTNLQRANHLILDGRPPKQIDAASVEPKA